MSGDGDIKQRWVPLESNPDVLNKYIHSLGVPNNWEFVDVYGLDPDLLIMVPRPVIAVMLLYPITEQSENPKNQLGELKDTSGAVYFMKQTVGNACGTIAVIHALANNREHIKFADNLHFNKFLEDTLGKDPCEIACILEQDQKMGAAHENTAQGGQTEAPSREDKINTHFIAFVCQDGNVLELDGRKSSPVCHGKTTAESFLEDAVEVVRKFMERDPNEINFTMMALANVASS